jgi:hypothetical protein
MKTLYEKLKPEYKQRLTEQQEDYPSIVKAIKIGLKENYFWSQLTVGQAKDLITFTDHAFSQVSSFDWSFGEKFFIADE